MTRKKTEILCPYCQGTFNASGYTSHCRSKHPEQYEAYMKDKASFIEKHKVVEGKTAPVVEEPITPSTPNEELMTTTVDGKGEEIPASEVEEKKPEPAPKEQLSGSFLGSVGKALRDW